MDEFAETSFTIKQTTAEVIYRRSGDPIPLGPMTLRLRLTADLPFRRFVSSLLILLYNNLREESSGIVVEKLQAFPEYDRLRLHHEIE